MNSRPRLRRIADSRPNIGDRLSRDSSAVLSAAKILTRCAHAEIGQPMGYTLGQLMG